MIRNSPVSHFVGGTLLRRYSISQLIVDTWPTHQWKIWKFTVAPKQYWQQLRAKLQQNDASTIALLRLFLQEIGDRLGVQNVEDWRRLGRNEIGNRDWRFLKQLGGLQYVLSKLYPNHRPRTAAETLHQTDLEVKVVTLLPRR